MPSRKPTQAALIVAAIAFLAAYLYSPQPLFAILSISSFLALVALDLLHVSRRHAGSSLREVLTAVIGAAVVWIALSFLLSTPSPIDVVTSCSMSPVLERGDLIFVQGQPSYAAPVFYYNDSIPNFHTNRSNCIISKRTSPGEYSTSISQCTSQILIVNLTNGTIFDIVNVSRSAVQSNDVIVYEATPPHLGLIIHRAVLRVANSSGRELVYLTKGDNNQVTDQEAGIATVAPSDIHGRLIFRIPLVGYFKLFLFGQFAEPAGCDTKVD